MCPSAAGAGAPPPRRTASSLDPDDVTYSTLLAATGAQAGGAPTGAKAAGADLPRRRRDPGVDGAAAARPPPHQGASISMRISCPASPLHRRQHELPAPPPSQLALKLLSHLLPTAASTGRVIPSPCYCPPRSSPLARGQPPLPPLDLQARQSPAAGPLRPCTTSSPGSP